MSAIALCAIASNRASGQARRPRVLASQREVRVIFPSDARRMWSWPARDDSTYVVAFGWGLSVSGMDGPRSLVLQVARRDREARTFTSLRHLVGSGFAGVCEPGMILACKPGLAATTDGDDVVLRLRERALIDQLFAMRPPTARVWQPGGEPGSFAYDSVRIEYVAPAIPEPNAALRAEAARRRRAYDVSINSISRHIELEGGIGRSSAWLALGDSAALRINEHQCTYDLCRVSRIDVPDPNWMVDDSLVVALRVRPPSTGIRRWVDGPDSVRYLVGRAPGRTTLRVRFGKMPSDTLPSRTPPAHELEQSIFVTLPIRRVTIEPRPTSVQVGQRVEFHLRVIDSLDAEVSGVPTELQVDGGAYAQRFAGDSRYAVLFDKPGVWRLVGRVGARTDTLEVAATSSRGSRGR